MAELKDIKFFKVTSLSTALESNAIYFVLKPNTTNFELYVTDLSGIPVPIADATTTGSVLSVTGTGVSGTILNPKVDIATFVSSQLNNQVYLSLNDGKLQVNPITSPNNSLEVNSTNTELQIQLSAAIQSQINSALQSGANISELTNDVGYLTIGDLNGTDLSYTPSTTNGTVTSSTGTDATIPLAGALNAGLLSPNEKLDIASAIQPNDLSTVATTGEYSDLINIPSEFPPSAHTHDISDINGTKAGFDNALIDGDFLFVGDVTQYTNEQAQDAVGNILVDSSTIDLTYNDSANTISADVKLNSIDSTHLVDNINVSEFINDSGVIGVNAAEALNALNTDKENISNKATDFTTVNNILYPTVQAVKDQLDLKESLTNKQNSLTPDGTGQKYITVDAIRSHTTDTSNPHSVTKSQVGLSNVDNTSDLNKPISTATQTALDSKANEQDLSQILTYETRWQTGDSNAFTLPDEAYSIISVVVQGVEKSKDYYSIPNSTTVTVLDDIYDDNFVRIVYATQSSSNLAPYYTQSQVDYLIQQKIANAEFGGSITASDSPSSSILGNAYWITTQAGTYTNFGGVVVEPNNLAIISRDSAGVFSISQTLLVLSAYALKDEAELKTDESISKNDYQSKDLSEVLNIVDGNGNIVAKIDSEGIEAIRVLTNEIESDKLSIKSIADDLMLSLDEKGLLVGKDIYTEDEVLNIVDGNGNIVFSANSEEVNYIGKSNGSGKSAVIKKEGKIYADVMQIIGYGQSLIVSGSFSTNSTFYNTLMFSGGIITSYDPSNTDARDSYYAGGLVELAANGVETPLKGFSKAFVEGIALLNGISVEEQNFELLVSVSGAGGLAMASLSDKNGIYYKRLLESVKYANDFCMASGKSHNVPALLFWQGENSADTNDSVEEYFEKATSLFTELNNDIKLITNQTNDIHFLVYQVATYTNNVLGTTGPALAYLKMALEVDNITLAPVMYAYEYADDFHMKADFTRLGGACSGLAAVRSVFNNEKQKPMYPVRCTITPNSSNNDWCVNIEINPTVAPLVVDTDTVPEATNYGFSILNGSGVELIHSVNVRRNGITLMTSSNPTGLKLTYCITGVALPGNIRDSQGDMYEIKANNTNYKVHNWVPMFEYQL